MSWFEVDQDDGIRLLIEARRGESSREVDQPPGDMRGTQRVFDDGRAQRGQLAEIAVRQLGVRPDQLGIADDGAERVDHLVPHRRGEVAELLESLGLVRFAVTSAGHDHLAMSLTPMRDRSVAAPDWICKDGAGSHGSPQPRMSPAPARAALADDPRLGPVGKVADIAALAELGDENKDLTAGQVDVQRLGRIAVRHGWRLERSWRSTKTRKTTLPSGPARSSTPMSDWKRRSPGSMR